MTETSPSTSNTAFQAEVFQNPYLPQDSSEVHAIMTVTATGVSTPSISRGSAPLLFGFIYDVSGSMSGAKITAARQGLIQAIHLLPAEASFFVVAGNASAKLVVPTTRASERAKARAIQQVKQTRAIGGTTISSWLRLALQEFERQPEAIRQALLLTDGENSSADQVNLRDALQRSEGQFQCHCRGVGTDWKVKELQAIGNQLLGTTDIIPQAEQLEEDFQSILGQALNKSTRAVNLRLWTPKGAQLLYCKQVSPEIQDLTGKAVSVSAQVQDYPTGAWGQAESRDYHFCIQVKPGRVGNEMLAGRASLVVETSSGEHNVAEAKVLAIWTDDQVQSAKISPQVAHYTGQAELATAIQTGLEAREQGQLETATAKLGRAVQLASASGNEATVKLLQNLVEVEDAATGTVKLRRDVNKADAMALETRSVKTTRTQTVRA